MRLTMADEMNEIDCGRWNEWDGLWTKENKMKHEVWTEWNEIKHEQWSW